jgi:NAD(P)-dependent dehydrogenase (short-subunit alcohol dehydrogenase family)
MEYNPFTLSGKKILVTGASSGIGRSIAIECSRLGGNVIITGRDSQRLNATFKQLSGEGHLILQADLLRHDDLNSLVDSLPLLDGIVHSAGIQKTLPFKFINEADLNSIIQTNFTMPTLLSQMLIKARKVKRDSSIVFISSVSGNLCSIIGNSMYSASKGAVNGIVKGMALELAVSGIRVNSVMPGMVESDLIFGNSTITSEQIQEDKKKYPLKRYGNPEEIAWAVIYLLSDASKWVTGSNLLIDGGYTLH